MLYEIIRKEYRKKVYVRKNYSNSIFYFSASDFEGLREEKYEVKASAGHTLAGRFYKYGGSREDRIIIFDHGMASGHRSYMREIEHICRRGYTVFTYDHTGYAESGGEYADGFVGSLIDLNDVLCALKSDERYRGVSFSVVGHSWGGFSALNISAFHPDLTHVVAMSAFVSIERIMQQYMGKIPFGMAKKIYTEECEKNPEFVTASAERSLAASDAHALIIHSRDDKTVSAELNFDFLKGALADRKNTYFIETVGRNHNPSYTAEALLYKKDFMLAHKRASKRLKKATSEQIREFISAWDFNKMTEQDTVLWDKIFEFLES